MFLSGGGGRGYPIQSELANEVFNHIFMHPIFKNNLQVSVFLQNIKKIYNKFIYTKKCLTIKNGISKVFLKINLKDYIVKVRLKNISSQNKKKNAVFPKLKESENHNKIKKLHINTCLLQKL